MPVITRSRVKNVNDHLIYLQDSNTYLQNSNTYLQDSNTYLQNSNTYLQNSNTYLQDSNTYLQDSNTNLKNINNILKTENKKNIEYIELLENNIENYWEYRVRKLRDICISKNQTIIILRLTLLFILLQNYLILYFGLVKYINILLYLAICIVNTLYLIWNYIITTASNVIQSIFMF